LEASTKVARTDKKKIETARQENYAAYLNKKSYSKVFVLETLRKDKVGAAHILSGTLTKDKETKEKELKEVRDDIKRLEDKRRGSISRTRLMRWTLLKLTRNSWRIESGETARLDQLEQRNRRSNFTDREATELNRLRKDRDDKEALVRDIEKRSARTQ